MAHLTLVPTPIGNLEDITLRALRVLQEADLVAAEDTRHSRKLLNHYSITTPLARLDAHTVSARGPAMLADHERVALITDAGTPGISDPGVELVQLALERGDKVEVLPGPTALIPALVLSGLPLGRFCFEGFLPRKGKARQERLEGMASSDTTSAFYESPKRLLKTLEELTKLCGPERRLSISRELSKQFETTYRGTLEQVSRHLASSEVKGEVVVVLGPAEKAQEAPDLHDTAKALVAQGITGRELRKALTALGAPRNLAYTLALEYGDNS